MGIAALVIPFIIALVIALRPAADVAADPLGFPTTLTLDNFFRTAQQLNYGRSLLNSTIFTVGSSIVIVIVGAMVSYPIARLARGWTNSLYRYFILGLTIPIFVLLAPLYLLFRDLHLLNTHIGTILIYSAMNLPIAVFFFSSFMRSVPVELEEAAALDGSGPYRTFFTIVFPLMRPIVATLAVTLVLSLWNDLIVPLIFMQGTDNRTVMSNAFALIDPRKADPTTLFPAALLGVAPLIIVFFILQRQIVDGIAAGAVK
ncbi:carbohydrate ABC transporter permease [Herbiconiux gentiana]|uniref:carbohydrate ABC transporter permease n=1 Tax=Herbiconiux gentiana TaxID=2970912 RepID=UPI00217F05C8|nr:carbohydrate ABC transporter permease [Herbiconiux gentiana]